MYNNRGDVYILRISCGDVDPTASTSADQAHPTSSSVTAAAPRSPTSCGDAHPADVSIDEQYWNLPG